MQRSYDLWKSWSGDWPLRINLQQWRSVWVTRFLKLGAVVGPKCSLHRVGVCCGSQMQRTLSPAGGRLVGPGAAVCVPHAANTGVGDLHAVALMSKARLWDPLPYVVTWLA